MKTYGEWLALMRPDDGLGGGGAAIQHRSDDPGEILDDSDFAAEAPEFEVAPAVGNQPDPWEGFDDDARAVAEAKGWKSPAEMAKSYKELETHLGKRDAEKDEELEALRRDLAATQQAIQGLGQQGGQQQPPADRAAAVEELFAPIDYRALDEASGGDTATAIAIYHEQVSMPRMRQALTLLGEEILENVQGQVGGVSQKVDRIGGTLSYQEQARQIARQHPRRFQQYQEDVVREMKGDPSLADRNDGMLIAFNRVLARKVAEEDAAGRAGDEGEALIGGATPNGRGGRRPERDIDAEIRAGIESAMPFAGQDFL